MRKTKLSLAMTALALVGLGLAGSARADLYEIGFTGDGFSASGLLDVIGNTATGGSLTVTAGLTPGTYQLVTGTGTSTGGNFNYDNDVNLSDTPFVVGTGILFTDTGLSTGSTQISVTASGVNYSVSGYPVGPTFTVTDFASAVPEPTTVIAGALMVLPFGAGAFRVLRKKQAA